MRCEQVQTELAREPIDAALGPAIDLHLAGCPTCESIRLLYVRTDEMLRQAPLWEPPEGFARRVGALAPVLAPSRPSTVPLILNGLTGAAILGVLIAVGVYLGVPVVESFTGIALDAYQGFVVLAAEASVADVVPVSWGCAALSLATAVWITRRTLG